MSGYVADEWRAAEQLPQGASLVHKPITAEALGSALRAALKR